MEEFYRNKPVAVWTSGVPGTRSTIHGGPQHEHSGRPGFPASIPEQVVRRAGTAIAPPGRASVSRRYRHSGDNVRRASLGAHKNDTLARPAHTRVGNTWNYTTEETPPVDISLSMLMLEDIALAGVGGEPVTVIGQQFKTFRRFGSR